MSHRSHLSAIVVGLAMLIAASASAKDPYFATADLDGNKAIVAKYTWGEKLTTIGDFVWLGQTDYWLVTDAGVTEVTQIGFGSGTFEWIGPYGYTYRITDYPENNGGAIVYGGIFKGTNKIGKFSVNAIDAEYEPASGRWAGGLAFPGGLSLSIALNIGDVGQPAWGDCTGHPARVEFLGHGYQDTSVVACSDGAGGVNYFASFFYYDERYNDSWFVSINAFYTQLKSGDLLQSADVSMFEISGSGAYLLGKMFTARPDRFGY